MSRNFILIVFVLASLLSLSSSSNAQPLFQDVSQTSGINLLSQSFGAGSWGDYNGDSLPDLWLGNHRDPPALFVNQGNDTFIDVAPLVVQFPRPSNTIDAHGAQWIDLDRDGDMDLVELTGGRSGRGLEPSLVWINQAGQLIDNAPALGLDYPACRGRTPLALDFNHDGWLDLFMSCAASATAPSSFFTSQSASFFPPLTLAPGILPPKPNQYAQLFKLSIDGYTEVYAPQHFDGGVIVDTYTSPWSSHQSKTFKGVRDSAFADIDGDLIVDKIIVKSDADGSFSDITSVTTNEVHASFITTKGSVIITQLQTTGSLSFVLESNPFRASNIHIGAANTIPKTLSFTLPPTDPLVLGMPTYIPGTDSGIYIGYDAALTTWTIAQTSTLYSPVAGKITSTAALSIVGTTGFPIVLSNLSIEKSSTQKSQYLPIQYGQSVVVADFDNDMDQDIYIVSALPSHNLANTFLMNDGTGNFTAPVTGAEGSLQGIGDSASTVDYNGDGLMDILLTNGSGPNLLASSGPVQLFKNISPPANHWLEIDLVGTTSNIDAIGATVHLDTGGTIQMRQQSGGMHLYTQNHSRLHFGLGPHALVNSIMVLWPSGKKEFWSNIRADKILKITEGTGANAPPTYAPPNYTPPPAYTPPVNTTPAATSNSSCMAPTFSPQVATFMFYAFLFSALTLIRNPPRWSFKSRRKT